MSEFRNSRALEVKFPDIIPLDEIQMIPTNVSTEINFVR